MAARRPSASSAQACGSLRYGDGSLIPKIGIALLVGGQVDPTKLPYTSGNAATGGYLDANGQADLPLIYFGS
jgi:hypothetical protein